MKIILSGGGTGGHIYPALTIADTIKKLKPEAEIRFVGTQHGLEKTWCPGRVILLILSMYRDSNAISARIL